MGKDPVCREEVDERSASSSTYQGRTYYFNSPECKADFDRDPARYAVSEAAGSTGAEFQAQAGRMSSRARSKMESMISERKNAAVDRIGAVSKAFRNVSQQLRDQNQEVVARYADKAAENVDRIAGYLQQRNAKEIIDEAEDLVRRRPGWTIGAALAAGFLTARFLKSSRSIPA